jgi:hypothetical protein
VTDCSASDTPRVSGVLTLIIMARRLGPAQQVQQKQQQKQQKESEEAQQLAVCS